MSENATDNTYSHWHQTGTVPRPVTQCDPLDSAIAFERYRLSVVSRWPEDDLKRQRVNAIQSSLERLESDRKIRHAGPC